MKKKFKDIEEIYKPEIKNRIFYLCDLAGVPKRDQEDILQDIAIKCARGWDNRHKGHKAYLNKTVHSVITDYFKQAGRQRTYFVFFKDSYWLEDCMAKMKYNDWSWRDIARKLGYCESGSVFLRYKDKVKQLLKS